MEQENLLRASSIFLKPFIYFTRKILQFNFALPFWINWSFKYCGGWDIVFGGRHQIRMASLTWDSLSTDFDPDSSDQRPSAPPADPPGPPITASDLRLQWLSPPRAEPKPTITPSEIETAPKLIPILPVNDLNQEKEQDVCQYPVKLENQSGHPGTKLDHPHHQLSLLSPAGQKKEEFDDLDNKQPMFLFSGGGDGWPAAVSGCSTSNSVVQTPSPNHISVLTRILTEEPIISSRKTIEKTETSKTPNPSNPFTNYFSPNSSNMFNNHSNSSLLSPENNPASPKGQTEACSAVDDGTETEPIDKLFEKKVALGTISSLKKCSGEGEGRSQSERLGTLFETGMFWDFYIRLANVTLDKPPRCFKVHKAILFAGSTVFAEMVRRAETDGKDFITVVNDNEIPWVAFGAFLKYFYTGSIDMSRMDTASHVQNLFKILDFSNKFHVMNLKEKCENILASEYLDQNPVEIMHYATEFHAVTLENIAMQYILRNAVDIFESEEFLKLNVPELCKIFGSDDLVVFNEEQVFTNLVRWGVSRCPQNSVMHSFELRRAIQAPLRCVRFSTMKLQVFLENVVEKDILTSYQIVDILKTFAPGKKQRSRDYIYQYPALGFYRFKSRKVISVFRPNDVPDVFKFQVNHPIRLLAVGVIVESDDGKGTFEITVTVDNESLHQVASGTKTCRSTPHCHLLSLKEPAGIRIHQDTWYTISGYVTPLDDQTHKMVFGVDKSPSNIVFECTKEGEIVNQKKVHFTVDENKDPVNFGEFGILDEIHFIAR